MGVRNPNGVKQKFQILLLMGLSNPNGNVREQKRFFGQDLFLMKNTHTYKTINEISK